MLQGFDLLASRWRGGASQTNFITTTISGTENSSWLLQSTAPSFTLERSDVSLILASLC